MNVGLFVDIFFNDIASLNSILDDNILNLFTFKKRLFNYFQKNLIENNSFLQNKNAFHKIFILIPQFNSKYFKTVVEEVLKTKGINFEEVIYYQDKWLNDLIKNRNIHYIISNSIDFLNKISLDTPCLSLNWETKNKEQRKISYFEKMGDMVSYIAKEKKKIENHIKDPITVLSGIPSIDKMWTRKQSIEQALVKLRSMKIYDYIYSNVCNNLDMPAILYFDKKISFRSLFKMVDEFAIELQDLGVKEDDIVTICSPNVPEAAIAFLAINKIGAVCLMLHPLLKSEEIKNALLETQSKVLITTEVSELEISKILSDTYVQNMIVSSVSNSMPILKKAIYNIMNLKNKLYNKEKSCPKIESSIYRQKWNSKRVRKEIETSSNLQYEPHKIAILLRTGGTTGVSKSVEITNEMCINNIEQLKYTIPSYQKFDVIEGITPLFHGFGLVDTILTAWSVNLAVDFHPKYDRKRFSKSVIKNEAVLILGVPTLFKSMIHNEQFKRKILSHLKVMISGGGPLGLALQDEINEWKKEHGAENPIFSGYGMTETVAAIAFTGLLSEHKDSVGYPLPFNNIKIVNPQSGQELGYGEVGEICVSGPTVMRRYFHNEKETELVLKRENGKLWLHTGDIGSLYPNGEICFVDRRKGLIIVSGINVYRNEIEEVIHTNEEIQDCAVIGIPHPYKMNVPKVFVVLKNGKVLDAEEKDRLLAYCNEKLDVYHKIFDMEQIDALPMTNMNKVNYLELENKEKQKQKRL